MSKTIEKFSRMEYNREEKKFSGKKGNIQHIIRSVIGMYLKERQKEFDDVKWYDSVAAKWDQCGNYAFCVKCDKERRYPCARAERRYYSKNNRIAIVRRHR